MTGDWRIAAFTAALKMIENGPPKDLVARAQVEAADRGEFVKGQDLDDVLVASDSADPFLSRLGMQIHKWDAAPVAEEWAQGTLQSTQERRTRICDLLGIGDAGSSALLAKRPIYHDHTIVISKDWERWYDAVRADEHAFYWPSYRDYLLQIKDWEPTAVTSVDIASSDVIERLADPTRLEAYQSKGLVVGYVQSGKTANFTGVIAKAVDAGYRLVVVMTGTIEMLRAQTQRRIDMELVGRQNILGDFTPEQAVEEKVDYQDDDSWLERKFADLGQSDLATGIRRLTEHHIDYKKQFLTLKIDRFDADASALRSPQPLSISSTIGDRQEERCRSAEARDGHQGQRQGVR